MKKIALILFLIGMISCDDQSGPEQDITGLVETDITGKVIKEPLLSLYPRCHIENYQGHPNPYYCLNPGYPNPTNDKIKYTIEVFEDMFLKMHLQDTTQNLKLILFQDTLLKGIHNLDLNVVNLLKLSRPNYPKKRYDLVLNSFPLVDSSRNILALDFIKVMN